MDTLMVVDDDNDILNFVTLILKSKGFNVIGFNNADNFMQKIKEIKPKVVLLDIQLGGFDGRELCKEIKQIEEHSNIAVILFSANNTWGDTLKDSMCDEFIEKPFELNTLIERIHYYISKN